MLFYYKGLITQIIIKVVYEFNVNNWSDIHKIVLLLRYISSLFINEV